MIRELLGIHAGEDQLYWVGLKRGLKPGPGGWKPAAPAPGLDAAGSLPDGSPAGLRSFLERIHPSGGRRLYLVLPRRYFFIRNLELPSLPPEDALAAVENSLKISVHLPVNEIYYDVQLCRLADGRTHGLLVYAVRREIDIWLDILHATGCRNRLAGLGPPALFVGAWLARRRRPLPLAVVSTRAGERELTVVARCGTCFSAAADDLDDDGVRRLVARRYPDVGEHLFTLGAEGGFPPLPSASPVLPPWLPAVDENPAVAAVAPTLTRLEPVCLDGRPPRLRLHRPLPWLLLIAVLAALAAVGLSRRATTREAVVAVAVERLQAENHKLERELEPLEERRKLARHAAALLGDVDAFMRRRPRLFTVLEDVAGRLPEDAWFMSVTLRKNVLTMDGQAPEALAVLDAVRRSAHVRQARLHGTVSKIGADRERFRIIVDLPEEMPAVGAAAVSLPAGAESEAVSGAAVKEAE
ncbi:MAG: PilN domain-containing protein [Deltaproteobacteria bacterium]|nr:PilN domain-containing protein [Candidatus Anaeroferrophillacea bacterium]